MFFEKMRIVEIKPKSKKRLEMVGIDSVRGGIDTKRIHLHFTVMAERVRTWMFMEGLVFTVLGWEAFNVLKRAFGWLSDQLVVTTSVLP